MRAWTAPEVPALTDRFGAAPAVVVHDTSTGRQVETRPSGTARLYVCGITPYDATHIGHASTYLAFDLLTRAWRDAGHDVVYVQNVTDVDDPLLERAAETGEPWDRLAEREVELYRDDMTALRMLPPDHFVGAVEAMPRIVELIGRLRTAGAAYDVDGDLYFPISADSRFGDVSHYDSETMAELSVERGGDPDRSGKKDPLDALLWRSERPGEPGWEAPWGVGRPGWHVECSAIALEHLGMTFDVQGGGSDLIFPHHEFSASHAQAAHGTGPFARAYVHAGMVSLDGEKMSKSRGNLVFVSGLLKAGADPMVIRLALLAQHYREDWPWTTEDLTRAERRLERWRAAAALETGPDASGLVAGVRSALARDLDAPAALSAVDEWVDEALSGTAARPDAGSPATMRALCDARLGVAL
ncbi:MAG: cysteine--1-D-myo-inosityl 2-amino-2-deoxy-alpha-D-glucopyranoside ligase [Propionibacteriales bacterium]|nr:cysteine--1-D-myo-inosityl 2-amino-2-deoxy-alpha-D-glucopyranoside ligase [Propionibacteriales bacterium]